MVYRYEAHGNKADEVFHLSTIMGHENVEEKAFREYLLKVLKGSTSKVKSDEIESFIFKGKY